MRMFNLITRPSDLGLDLFSERFHSLLDGFDCCPALDLVEGEQGWTMHVDLPGVKPEDLAVHVENGVLSLEATRKPSEEWKDKAAIVRERSFGTWRREVSLPDGVDAEKIEARFQDGVLTLTMPKREDAKPKRIEVKVK